MIASIIKLFLEVLSSVGNYLGARQLLDAGKASAEKDALAESMQNVRDSHAATDEISNNPHGDYARSVREKYTRDGE